MGKQHAVLRRSRQQRMQNSSFSHSGSTSHPPVCVSRWCKDSCDHVGVILAGLLQLDTVQHLFIRPQQTTACIKRPSVYRNDHQKTRSHHTGVSTYSSAPCYCPHSVQNHTADITDTHYPSTELHTRPTPDALLVTTTQVHQSQPAWNSADENRFRSMQLHLQCFTHLEQSTSHHHCLLGRHCKHFQNGTSHGPVSVCLSVRHKSEFY